jgi:hypothetical protein
VTAHHPVVPWRRQLLSTSLFVASLGPVLASCLARGSDIEPRYVALHNAFAALGLAQTGPLHHASLAEGRDIRLPLTLAAQCTTVVALGGQGVRDLDATLLDPDGKLVARDMTSEPQAVLRACVETAGTYALRIRMAAGAGDVMAATWSGSAGSGPSPNAGAAAAVVMGAGTCDSPMPLAAGSFNGTTSRGESNHEGDCANTTSREMIYRFELTGRKRVSIDVDPRFDAVIYLRKDDCADASAQIACNDDGTHGHNSHIDEVLDAGTYFLFIDGYSGEAGTFRASVSMNDIPSLAETCQKARPLAAGPPMAGSLAGAFDQLQAQGCSGDSKGPDVLYRLDVPRRSRARIVERSSAFTPLIHVRRRCVEPGSEIECVESGFADGEATFVGMLEAGSYAVAADTADHEADGIFSIAAELAPEGGQGGMPGDNCADAVPLSPHEREVSGDTFSARDDVSGKCGGAGQPDVVYRLELPRRSRVTGSFSAEEGAHVLILRKSCADASSELACGDEIDAVVPAGVYFLTVDGDGAHGLGRFTFTWRARDVALQEVACRGAPLLVSGSTVHGNTHGGGDKFDSSCGGPDDVQASADRVHKIVLPAKGKVRLTVTAPGWDPVLVLRRACLDTGGVNTQGPEIACNNDAEDTHHARIEATLEPGTYFVVVDGHARGNEGAYTLEYRLER